METHTVRPRPGRYLLWSAAVGMILILGVIACARAVPELDMLFMENGPLENLSVALWLLSAFAAAAAYRRWTLPLDRLAAFWTAAVACLAALREVDAHHLLCPPVLGRFGIQYRISWLLDPHASILLKLAYAVFILLILSLVLVPLLRLRPPFWRLARGGDAAMGMFIMTGVGMFLGYSLDDLLRGSPLMVKAVRQLTEETSECLAALAFCTGALLLWKVPVSERIRQVHD
jgi:hypothetical protein